MKYQNVNKKYEQWWKSGHLPDSNLFSAASASASSSTSASVAHNTSIQSNKELSPRLPPLLNPPDSAKGQGRSLPPSHQFHPRQPDFELQQPALNFPSSPVSPVRVNFPMLPPNSSSSSPSSNTNSRSSSSAPHVNATLSHGKKRKYAAAAETPTQPIPSATEGETTAEKKTDGARPRKKMKPGLRVAIPQPSCASTIQPLDKGGTSPRPHSFPYSQQNAGHSALTPGGGVTPQLPPHLLLRNAAFNAYPIAGGRSSNHPSQEISSASQQSRPSEKVSTGDSHRDKG